MSAPETSEAPIDVSRRFLPEAHTPLFHTRVYAELPKPVQLRYNQLHGLYFNEQVVYFEQEMLSPMLRAMQRSPLPSALAPKLDSFLADEQRHTAMFLALNQRCAPAFYAKQPFRFIRVQPGAQAVLAGLCSRPHLFPLLAWLTLLQEERALYYSKGCLDEGDALEPQFLATHRAHLADEVGHVRIDEELLDWLWLRTPRALRVLNARLLGWLIGEFFLLPKRAGMNVVNQLGREFPHLDLRRLRRELRDLRTNPTFLCTLYSRDMTPRSFARFDAHPEFAFLSRTLPGYAVAGAI